MSAATITPFWTVYVPANMDPSSIAHQPGSQGEFMPGTRPHQATGARLQVFSDGSDRLATARAKQQQLEEVMRQWDWVDDLSRAVHVLRQEREGIKTTIEESESVLAVWSQEVLEALNEESQATVHALGIPGVESASIHPTNYLPLLKASRSRTSAAAVESSPPRRSPTGPP